MQNQNIKISAASRESKSCRHSMLIKEYAYGGHTGNFICLQCECLITPVMRLSNRQNHAPIDNPAVLGNPGAAAAQGISFFSSVDVGLALCRGNRVFIVRKQIARARGLRNRGCSAKVSPEGFRRKASRDGFTASFAGHHRLRRAAG